jgi:hypothetical protein
MYSITKTDFGVKIVFSGFIKQDEMVKWVAESQKIIPSLPAKFGVMIDMRDLKPLAQETETEMEKGQRLYKDKGMEKSVVILHNSITTMQFKRIAKETGIDQWERYIDASKVPNFEEVGKNWLVNGTDPGK